MDFGIAIHYSFNSDGFEETIVSSEGGGTLNLKDYLELYVDESKHEMIRTNIFNINLYCLSCLNLCSKYSHAIRFIIVEKSLMFPF